MVYDTVNSLQHNVTEYAHSALIYSECLQMHLRYSKFEFIKLFHDDSTVKL